jgi:hypothetical protein
MKSSVLPPRHISKLPVSVGDNALLLVGCSSYPANVGDLLMIMKGGVVPPAKASNAGLDMVGSIHDPGTVASTSRHQTNNLDFDDCRGRSDDWRQARISSSKL